MAVQLSYRPSTVPSTFCVSPFRVTVRAQQYAYDFLARHGTEIVLRNRVVGRNSIGDFVLKDDELVVQADIAFYCANPVPFH